MEHAHHFLSRLDRITPEQVDFALAFYRDHELVRYVLSQASLPAEVSRVAIAVEDSGTGPFLVVTRDGKFVTCLGEGMSTGDLPILTRGKIEALQAKRQDLRERILAATEAIRKRGDAASFTNVLFSSGQMLCREDFVALTGIQALLEDRLLVKYLDVATNLETLKTHLMKIERPKPVSFPLMRRYWDNIWALGHLGILAFMNGKMMVERWSERLDIPIPFAWGCVRQNISQLAMRGAWVSGKTGKLQLRMLKTNFENALSPLQYITAAVSLGAIALRHSRLHEEIRKTVASTETTDELNVRPSLHMAVKRLLMIALDHPEDLKGLHRQAGAGAFLAWSEAFGKHKLDPEYRFSSVEEVPEDLACAMATYDARPFLVEHEPLLQIFACLPWIAQAEPENFFFPRKLADHMRPIWQPRDSVLLMQPLREHYRESDLAQARREREKPSRKGPCPCGSGKKYKRCCGKDEPVGEDEE